MARKGTCVDCDRTVEVTDHGTCATCGSSSIMKVQYNKAMNSMSPVMSIDAILAAVNEIMVKIGHKDASVVELAALQFISARLARMQGLSLGEHLENTLSTWQMCTEVEEAEVEGGKSN